MEDALEFAMNDVSTDLEDNMPAEGSVLSCGIIGSFDGDTVSQENPFRSHQLNGPLISDVSIQGWASRYSRLDPAVKVGDPEFRDLNLSQIRSISMACGNSVSLIQGVCRHINALPS